MLSCFGCTYEGPHDGCDGESLNLIFTNDGSTANFDRLVASDIELYLYDSEGKKIEALHIPYENIKGGKPYSIEQQYVGNTYLVAWSLSGDEAVNKLSPVCLDDENYSTARFIMGERLTRQSHAYSGSARDFFLKSLMFNQNPLEERTLNVDVKQQLCTITVIIEDGNDFRTQYPGKLSVNIEGSSYSYEVAGDKQSGGGIIIEDNFSYLKDSDEYISRNKVMPASTDSATGLEDNLVVKLFADGIARLMVETEVKAQSGTEVNVVIRPTKLEAVITADSWQIRKGLVVL